MKVTTDTTTLDHRGRHNQHYHVRPQRAPEPTLPPPPAGPASPDTPPSAPAASASGSRSAAAEQPESSAGEEPAVRKGEGPCGSSSKASHLSSLPPHQTRSGAPHRDPPPPPPISKMDSCHISEDRGPWDSVRAGGAAPPGFAAAGSSPRPASSPGATLPDSGAIVRGRVPRLRLTRRGRSRGRGRGSGVTSGPAPPPRKNTSLPDAAETDGYFSDGEQSEPDTRSGARQLHLPQLHSGKEELLRRSVLAS
ncbi:hypothetical protein EYF80_065019 [Liparis tanakae]|uniref:Uncharacterized protein n=1 Tax=Liparis tanakae TaxID=230148 RepID=A0A4Z2E7E6_9TELE|nr:hypothetical protein EYF80_065019 [Liparis tanakae]